MKNLFINFTITTALITLISPLAFASPKSGSKLPSGPYYAMGTMFNNSWREILNRNGRTCIKIVDGPPNNVRGREEIMISSVSNRGGKLYIDGKNQEIEIIPLKNFPLVNQLIPDYRQQLEGSFTDKTIKYWNSLSQLTSLPSFDATLNQLGDIGKFAQSLLRARQEIINTNFSYGALANAFVIPQDVNLPGGMGTTPWSQINEQVYLRFLAPKGALNDGIAQVRIVGRSQTKELDKVNLIKSNVESKQVISSLPGNNNRSASSVTAEALLSNISQYDFSIKNYTLRGHIFYPGEVTRKVIDTGTSIAVMTTGEGVGKKKEFNLLVSPSVWDAADARLGVQMMLILNYENNNW